MKTVVVIGGGASGFMFAVELARKRLPINVIILEKNSHVLQKVKVSGGGRCNVTHACFMNSELVKNYPRGKAFLKKTVQQFSTKDTVEWFKQFGVELKQENDGRMFPMSNSSQTIIDTFLHLCTTLNIELRTQHEVLEVNPTADSFLLRIKNKPDLLADNIMIACGGFNKTSAYDWIRSLGHTIIDPKPSLFTFNMPKHPITVLMGLSVPMVKVKILQTEFEATGPILITHWGLSGPAVLKLSAFAAEALSNLNYSFRISINWLNTPENELIKRWNTLRNGMGAQLLSHKNPFELPQRLWHYLLEDVGIATDTKWSELSAKEQNKLIHTLTTQEMNIQGKTTFKEEFVTCGGVSLDEVNPQTMESKLIKGIYFGGEVLNVDGITGGFNFQHAWTSGFIAAQAAAMEFTG